MQNAAQQLPWEGLVVECVWQSSNVQDIWFVMCCTMRVTSNCENSKKKTTKQTLHSENQRILERAHVEMDPQKSIENRFKMVPGTRLEEAWRLPGAWWPFRAGFQTQPKVDEKIEGFWDAPGTSREAPGDSEGRKKSTENRFVAENLLSNRRLFVDFRTQYRFSCFLSDLTSICHRKSMRNRWTKHICFHSSVCFFEGGDLHETSYFAMQKLLFHFCRFCMFSQKT